MDRRDALITALLLGLLCVAITVVVVVRRDPFSDTNATEPPPPNEPELAGGDDDAELDAFVAEAIDFIEAVRGRSFLVAPVVVVLAEDDFVARVDADFVEAFDESPEELAELNAQYRSTALIGADESIDDVVRRFGEAGILGFYDPGTDELVVREANGLSLLTKSTIVHELVHAFDDQHFDLDREEYDDRTDELPWTFRAVAEGSASWVEEEWRQSLSNAERGDLLEEELAFGDLDILSRFELSFLLLELSPHESGEPFVAGLVDDQGVGALDALFDDPPETSEQIIRPDRFAADEQAIAVPTPPADGAVLYEGAGGQALIEALFTGNFVGVDVVWGGDQMVVWVDEIGRSCLRWDLRSDTAEGLEDLQRGFELWGNAVGSTRVEELDGITIRVDRCA